MFLGHFAVGFAAKRAAPETSLAVLVGAAALLDVLFPVFLLAGWEDVSITPAANPLLRMVFFYPFSHSLAAAALWAGVAALAYWAAARKRAGALAVCGAVLSHWLLDFASHRPDMPLHPGDSPVLGLGLWNSVAATAAVEGLMLGAGLWLYTSATRPVSRKGTYGLWSFVALLALLYVASLTGPPPPGARAVAWAGIALTGLLLWIAWFDRHRTTRPGGCLSPTFRPAGREGRPGSGNARA